VAASRQWQAAEGECRVSHRPEDDFMIGLGKGCDEVTMYVGYHVCIGGHEHLDIR